MARTGPFGRTAPAVGAAALFAAAVLAGAGFPGRQAEPPGAAAVVEMTASNTFEPKHLTVRPGQSVVWKNLSDRGHTVSTESGDARRSNVPAGARPFRSGEVGTRDSFSYRFTVAGTYRYACEHHRDAGMTGTVLVRPAR